MQPTEKPEVGLAPTSHCHCVVGGVRIQPRLEPSVRPEERQVKYKDHVAEGGLTSVAVDAVFAWW